MGDLGNQHWPENECIIRKMKEQVDLNLGDGKWSELTGDNAPDASMDCFDLCKATGSFFAKFDKIADEKMANKIFSQVRHGLTHADFTWAREKFLQYNDIDSFAKAILGEQLAELKSHMQNDTLFYGQPITPEGFEFVSSTENIFYGKRYGNKILSTAIPCMTADYLKATDERQKRYHMCHCQFARESILGDTPVSKSLCYCSMGHTKIFWETILDTHLEGDVIMSALGGDEICKFVIYLPDEVMKKYVK